jgi:uncharacterized protein YecT (DUF1311 family)
MKSLFIISVLLLAGLNGFGQEEKHPIDIKQEQCLAIDSNATTMGMIQCTIRAADEWKNEMDKYLELLNVNLNLEEKEKLNKSQTEWLVFSKLEVDFIHMIYSNKDGSMWMVVTAGELCDLVRSRSLKLKGYYEILTFDEK